MKKISKIAVMIMMALGMAFVIPKTEVKAATDYKAMSFDEAISYWSAQPLFDQIYALEKDKSDYPQVTKDNKVNYFRASLVDTVNRPDSVKNARPLTYNYMTGVLNFSNSNFVNIIKGSSTKSELRVTIDTEVAYFMPYSTTSERDSVASNLVSKLNADGITTTSEYNGWKNRHGGLTAYEVYYGAYAYTYAVAPYYGYWWNGYWWNGYAWVAQYAKAANAVNLAITQDAAAIAQEQADTVAAINAEVQSNEADINATIDDFNAQIAETQAAYDAAVNAIFN